MMTTIALWLTLLAGIGALAMMFLTRGEEAKARVNRHPLRGNCKKRGITARVEQDHSDSSKHWLLGIEGDVMGQSYHLGDRTLTIGRKASNYVQLTELSASRVHCQVMPQMGGIRILDMQSRNGLQVNNKPVASCLLKDGDVVKIGDSTFLYRVAGDYGHNLGNSSKKTHKETMFPTLLQRA